MACSSTHFVQTGQSWACLSSLDIGSALKIRQSPPVCFTAAEPPLSRAWAGVRIGQLLSPGFDNAHELQIPGAW